MQEALHRPRPCTTVARQTQGTRCEGAKAGKTGRVALSRSSLGDRLQPLMKACLSCTTLDIQQRLSHSPLLMRARREQSSVLSQDKLHSKLQEPTVPCLPSTAACPASYTLHSREASQGTATALAVSEVTDVLRENTGALDNKTTASHTQGECFELAHENCKGGFCFLLQHFQNSKGI